MSAAGCRKSAGSPFRCLGKIVADLGNLVAPKEAMSGNILILSYFRVALGISPNSSWYNFEK
jgi:hypothetical protein